MLSLVKGTHNRALISTTGRVFKKYPKAPKYPERGYNPFKEVFCKPNSSGYLQVNLPDRGTCMIHRLVAEAFIPNPDNLPEVDHINGNKLDNRVENLRWISHKDNCNNNSHVKRGSNSEIWTNIKAIDSAGHTFKFSSMKEVGTWFGKRVGKGWGSAIMKCMRNEGGYAYGYCWFGSKVDRYDRNYCKGN